MVLTLLKGSNEFNREDHITMFNSNIEKIDEKGIVYNEEDATWVPFGEDNDEITRETNNETDATKNVLGRTKVKHTPGPQTTEIDPIAIRGNDALSTILYYMFKYNLTGDKAKLQCMEVTLADEQEDGSYGAFTETAIVNLNSWGGDTTQLNSPITLNWLDDRVHGTYKTADNKFTPTVAK